MSASCQLTCRSRVCLPENIHVDAYGRANPAPTLANCGISWLDVSVFVCALGDFLVLFAPVLRQIARYLPHRRSENASKTHPKSSHDKFKTASKLVTYITTLVLQLAELE